MSGLHKFTTKHVGRVSDDVCHLLRTSGCFGKAKQGPAGSDAGGDSEVRGSAKQARDFGAPGGVDGGCRLSHEEQKIAEHLSKQ